MGLAVQLISDSYIRKRASIEEGVNLRSVVFRSAAAAGIEESAIGKWRAGDNHDLDLKRENAKSVRRSRSRFLSLAAEDLTNVS